MDGCEKLANANTEKKTAWLQSFSTLVSSRGRSGSRVPIHSMLGRFSGNDPGVSEGSVHHAAVTHPAPSESFLPRQVVGVLKTTSLFQGVFAGGGLSKASPNFWMRLPASNLTGAQQGKRNGMTRGRKKEENKTLWFPLRESLGTSRSAAAVRLSLALQVP